MIRERLSNFQPVFFLRVFAVAALVGSGLMSGTARAATAKEMTALKNVERIQLSTSNGCTPYSYQYYWVNDGSVLGCQMPAAVNKKVCNGRSVGTMKSGVSGNEYPSPLKSMKGFQRLCDSNGMVNYWIKTSKVANRHFYVCLGSDLSGTRTQSKKLVAQFKKGVEYKDCFKPAFTAVDSLIKELRLKPRDASNVSRGCTVGNYADGPVYPQEMNAAGCDYSFVAEPKMGQYPASALYTLRVELLRVNSGGLKMRTLLSSTLVE